MSLEEVLRNHEEALMRLPNVTGVGIGERDGKEVIKVFVSRKVPEAALRPQEIVPKSIEGCDTDVEEIGVVRAEGHDAERQRRECHGSRRDQDDPG